MRVSYAWRGDFDNTEINELHAEAFETRVFDESEWNWKELLNRHSLGWVVARDEEQRLIGFVNVLWDGLVHAWLQDTMVSSTVRGQGVGTRLVTAARKGARDAQCEWLHVDFDDHLRRFYFDACGFTPTNGGLIALQDAQDARNAQEVEDARHAHGVEDAEDARHAQGANDARHAQDADDTRAG